jgi:hypothetical protein
VDASALGAGNTLTFNGGAENDGYFDFIGGAGNDVLTGGNGGANSGDDVIDTGDSYNLIAGGNDTVHAGSGADYFELGAAFTSADAIDGGTGEDYLSLNGDYSAGLTLGATTLTNVEAIGLQGGHSYNLTTNDATVASGKTLEVDANGFGAGDTLTFNGSAETNGSFVIVGGAGNDNLTGGQNSDTIDLSKGGNDVADGGGGADSITGVLFGPHETFVYKAVGDSTSVNYDHITNVDFNNDVFNVSAIGAVTGVDAEVDGGALSTASFDSDLAAAIGSGHLAAHHAVFFVPDSGTLANRAFLIIDENGTSGYQAGQDLVIWCQIDTGTLTAANFA